MLPSNSQLSLTVYMDEFEKTSRKIVLVVICNYINPRTSPAYLNAADHVAYIELPHLVLSIFQTILFTNLVTMTLTALTRYESELLEV